MSGYWTDVTGNRIGLTEANIEILEESNWFTLWQQGEEK